MRYKSYFTNKYKPKIRFPRNAKRQARKKRLKLKSSRLEAKRVKNVDSKIKKFLTSILLLSPVGTYFFPFLVYLTIASICVIFVAEITASLINKKEKQFEVISKADNLFNK